MQRKNIVDLLEEHRLFKQIGRLNHLLFIGDRETVEKLKINLYLEKFNFIDAEDLISDASTSISSKYNDLLSKSQTIVIASLDNEHNLYSEIYPKIVEISGTVPILKLFSDIFINFRLRRYLLQPSECEFRSPKTSYAIITTPRSGSTFLCEMLKATGVAGFPSEHLQAMTQELVKNCHFDSLRYLKILMTNQVTNNGVFGTKFISNFLLDHQRFDPNFTQVFETHIPKFIFLTRKDKLAQAVSIFVAKTTHVWHSFQIDTAEEYQDRIGKIDVECVDLERINRIYKTLVRQERKIKKLLRKYKIKPLVIEYEKFTGNPEANIKKILNYLDIKDEYAPIDTNRVKTRKLSSDVSKRIIERYNSEYLQSHKQMTVDLEEKVVRLIK